MDRPDPTPADPRPLVRLDVTDRTPLEGARAVNDALMAATGRQEPFAAVIQMPSRHTMDADAVGAARRARLSVGEGSDPAAGQQVGADEHPGADPGTARWAAAAISAVVPRRSAE